MIAEIPLTSTALLKVHTGDSLHDLTLVNLFSSDVDTRDSSNISNSPAGDSVPPKQFEEAPEVVLRFWFGGLVSAASCSPG